MGLDRRLEAVGGARDIRDTWPVAAAAQIGRMVAHLGRLHLPGARVKCAARTGVCLFEPHLQDVGAARW